MNPACYHGALKVALGEINGGALRKEMAVLNVGM
jgi:hypothetical protein